MKAYAVRSTIKPRAPTPGRGTAGSGRNRRDRRVTAVLDACGRQTAQDAMTILLSGYCSDAPAVVTSAVVQALRLVLLGTKDRSLWGQHLQSSLQNDAAVEAAARLDKHRRLRRMTPARFMEVLLSQAKAVGTRDVAA